MLWPELRQGPTGQASDATHDEYSSTSRAMAICLHAAQQNHTTTMSRLSMHMAILVAYNCSAMYCYVTLLLIIPCYSPLCHHQPVNQRVTEPELSMINYQSLVQH